MTTTTVGVLWEGLEDEGLGNNYGCRKYPEVQRLLCELQTTVER